MIAFACPSCQKKLSVKDELAGKKAKCPGCSKVVSIPTLADVGLGGNVRPSEPHHEDGRNLPPGPPAPAEDRTLPPRQRDQARQESLSDADGQTGLEAESKGELTQSVSPRGPGRELYDFLAPPERPDEIGRLGSYRVLKVLGAGGMGVVFLAEDPGLERRVALKAMLPALAASDSARLRFLREAKTAAAIEHDHIVPIFQVGEDHGVPFIAMPFLKGEPLDARLERDKALPISEILRIGREAAEGLAAAHEQGLVHRDIKPANLWLEAPRGRVKILDFGLARASTDNVQLTQQGAIIGTPAYMAPEQGSGQALDGRCDLFSLGCVLYRLATGQLPFKGADTVSTLLAVATANPPPPAKLRPELPAALSSLVMQLLAKNPEERPQSAKAVAEALSGMGEAARGWTAAQLPRTPPLESTLRTSSQSRPLWPWLAGAAGLLGLAIVVTLVALKKEPVADEEQASPKIPSGDGEPRLVPGTILARIGPARAELLRGGGGNEQSEAAVDLGLQWLVRNQLGNGSWTLAGYDPDYGTMGAGSDIAGTALAVLPLLGAGHTPKDGKFAPNVDRGLNYLLSKQKADGDFGAGMYVQGLATIAVSEALGLTGEERFKTPAQEAVNYLVRAQHTAGGWRYSPGDPGDTSVTGWQ
jgi:serine/threonine protein kinase